MDTTTTTTMETSHRRSPRRSGLRRAVAATLPALVAASIFVPAAGALSRPVPDYPDSGTSTGGGSTGGSTGSGSTCSTTGTQYRVTLQKFRVTTATYDHFLQIDGKGDEVFVSNTNVKLGANGAVLADFGTNTSVTMGDQNGYPYRQRAGSLSSLGGLQAGDVHTTNRVLWQGALRDGEAMVITPTIWEWDGGGDGFQAWSSWASNLASHLSSRAGELFGEEVGKWITLADIGLAGVAKMPLGSAGDKPIGTVDGSGGSTFTPRMLVLDPASIAEIMNDANPIGEGRCVIGVDYAGSNDHGRYTLYLKIERF